jgi:hypothetical protein
MNRIEQSPSWEASSNTTIQDISYFLWNPKFNCLVDKNQNLYNI